MTEPIITDWHGCYEGGWKGQIVEAAFAHPAKFSRALITKIIEHGLKCGYWKKGDTIGDCFGGVALGGIIAGYHGLNWIGVELEPRFVELGNQNLAMHGPRWLALEQATQVRLVQGDSRRFAEIVGEVCGVVSSPPYADTPTSAGNVGNATEKSWGKGKRIASATEEYGQTPGQIGSLPAGQLDAAITSPPYSDTGASGTDTPARDGIDASGQRRGGSTRYEYGDTPGQIGALRSGELDAVVTSPPFRDARSDTTKSTPTHAGPALEQHYTTQAGAGYGETEGQIDTLPTGTLDGAVTSPPFEDTTDGTNADPRNANKPGFRPNQITSEQPSTNDEYGETDGQIGNDSGETYWKAMAQVYAQMHAAIKPDGIAAIVVKDHVKDKQRVPLCDQTCTLLESVGFTVFERCRCWLVKEDRHPGLFDGEDVVKTTERKSFFRRLAEKKGSPRIDWEEVIWCRRETP